MPILVTYDSVSPNKNTEKIAKVISEVLREKNFEVTCLHIDTVDKSAVKNYGCVLVGSPTMGWSATKPVKQFLESYNANEFTGKQAAAFDTRVESRMSGQATKGIQRSLERLGFKIIMPPLVAYVEHKNDYMLKQGQIEKAQKYAEDLAKTLRV